MSKRHRARRKGGKLSVSRRLPINLVRAVYLRHFLKDLRGSVLRKTWFTDSYRHAILVCPAKPEVSSMGGTPSNPLLDSQFEMKKDRVNTLIHRHSGINRRSPEECPWKTEETRVQYWLH